MNTEKTYEIKDEIEYYVIEQKNWNYIYNIISCLIFYKRSITVNVALTSGI